MAKLIVRNISNAILPLRDAEFAILPSKVVDLCQIFNDPDVKGLLKRPDIFRLLETGRIVIEEKVEGVNHVMVGEENEENDTESEIKDDLDAMTTAELKVLCEEKNLKPPNSRKKILEMLRRKGEDE